jgi:hypothetical protein
MPASIDWRGLEAEMKANIHLGFVAGACVTPLKQGRWVAWRPAAALASVMVLAAMSWWLQAPEPGSPQSAATGVFLEATPSGIEMQENGRGLTLMYPRSESVIRTVSAQGALRARYVDADGQVTISNVYVQ